MLTAPSTAAAVWLLDVDGVLNASRSGWSAAPKGFTVNTAHSSYRIKFAPPVAMRIAALHTRGAVEVRWSTSWVEYVRDLERGMALPALQTAIAPSLRGEALDEAKREAAVQVVRSGKRLVWTDDEAIPEDGPVREELEAAGALLIAPRPSRGLRPEHLEQIHHFLGVKDEFAA